MSLGVVDHFRTVDEAREKAARLLHDLRHKRLDPLGSRERLSDRYTELHLVDPKSTRPMQLAAARELLDRAYGRPAQTIQGPDESPLLPFADVSPLERARRIAYALSVPLRVLESQPVLEPDEQETTTAEENGSPA